MLAGGSGDCENEKAWVLKGANRSPEGFARMLVQTIGGAEN